MMRENEPQTQIAQSGENAAQEFARYIKDARLDDCSAKTLGSPDSASYFSSVQIE